MRRYNEPGIEGKGVLPCLIADGSGAQLLLL